jgi:hypothetical protein
VNQIYTGRFYLSAIVFDSRRFFFTRIPKCSITPGLTAEIRAHKFIEKRSFRSIVEVKTSLGAPHTFYSRAVN